MKKTFLIALAVFCLSAAPAFAHFGIVQPSHSTVFTKQDAALSFKLAFLHPMEQHGMNLEKPQAFTVYHDGTSENLLPALQESKVLNKKAWTAKYTIKRPSVYQFVMQPTPYWEPSEDCFIIHYTKTVVAAFGEEEGWNEPTGVRTEIVPLTRPFANYASGVFQGQVLLDGKPAPHSFVEIEYYNEYNTKSAPNAYFVTQSVEADDNGVFTYVVPFAGWWGFAALNTAPETMDYKGKAKAIELGAVLWTEFTSPMAAK